MVNITATEGYEKTLLGKQLQESQALFEISQMLAGTIDLKVILQQIADAANSLVKTSSVAILHLLDDSNDYLQAMAVSGISHPGSHRRMNFKLGEGIAGIAISARQTINIYDVNSDERYISDRPESEVIYRSLLVAPIRTGEKSLGTLSVQSETTGSFTQDDERLLSILGTQAALAIEKARLLETERQQRELAEALSEISAELNKGLDFSKVLGLLRMHFDYSLVQIYLADRETDAFKLILLDEREAYKEDRSPNLGDSVSHVAQTGQFYLNNTVTNMEANTYGVGAELVLPIISSEHLLGMLHIHHSAQNIFNDHELRLLSAVADQLAVSIEKDRLYADLQASLHQEKAARAQLVQSEKLAALGRIVASVAHELNNPIQAIQNALYLIKLEETLSAQAMEDLQTILNEADRMTDLVARLRETYRPAMSEEFTLGSINSLVIEVQKLLSTHLRRNKVTFRFTPQNDLISVPMIADQIKQVLLNICLNAVEAMPEGGILILQTNNSRNPDGIVFRISDSGPSINPKILPYIFDPFVTTKEGGTGLGLAISYDIVQRHQGRIDAKSEAGAGAVFEVWLPAERKIEIGRQYEGIWLDSVDGL